MADRKIEVACYAGHKGDERPKSFLLNGETIEVTSIVREWVEEDRENRKRKRFFTVKGNDGYTYTLCYDEDASAWFLTKR